MKEFSQELQAHYGQLLGIESPWQVREVKLEMAQKRVEIEIGWGPLARRCIVPSAGESVR